MSEQNNISNKNADKRVRVLIVAATLPIVGGQTVQAARLLQRLKNDGRVDADILSINPVWMPSLQKIKYVRTLLTWPKYIFDLLANVRHYDVIHIFSASYLSFVISPTPAMIVAKLAGKKTILNYHSGEADDHLSTWPMTAPLTISEFDRIIVPSNYLVDVFGKHGFKAEPIFNFIELEQFPYRDRSPIKPVFLSNRNFEPHYNVGEVLKAFRTIQNEFSEASLIVVGDGSQREYLHSLSAELHLKNVDFRGAVDPDTIPQIYNEADIYLNSSSIDNMPLSILEAFASGLPVVTTNAGGIPYIVKNEVTALMSGIGDHQTLTSNALRLLNEPELARRLTASAHQEVQRYSWQNVGNNWVKAYTELAAL